MKLSKIKSAAEKIYGLSLEGTSLAYLARPKINSFYEYAEKLKQQETLSSLGLFGGDVDRSLMGRLEQYENSFNKLVPDSIAASGFYNEQLNIIKENSLQDFYNKTLGHAELQAREFSELANPCSASALGAAGLSDSQIQAADLSAQLLSMPLLEQQISSLSAAGSVEAELRKYIEPVGTVKENFSQDSYTKSLALAELQTREFAGLANPYLTSALGAAALSDSQIQVAALRVQQSPMLSATAAVKANRYGDPENIENNMLVMSSHHIQNMAAAQASLSGAMGDMGNVLFGSDFLLRRFEIEQQEIIRRSVEGYRSVRDPLWEFRESLMNCADPTFEDRIVKALYEDQAEEAAEIAEQEGDARTGIVLPSGKAGLRLLAMEQPLGERTEGLALIEFISEEQACDLSEFAKSAAQKFGCLLDALLDDPSKLWFVIFPRLRDIKVAVEKSRENTLLLAKAEEQQEKLGNLEVEIEKYNKAKAGRAQGRSKQREKLVERKEAWQDYVLLLIKNLMKRPDAKKFIIQSSLLLNRRKLAEAVVDELQKMEARKEMLPFPLVKFDSVYKFLRESTVLHDYESKNAFLKWA